jgi:hypothetical protein
MGKVGLGRDVGEYGEGPIARHWRTCRDLYEMGIENVMVVHALRRAMSCIDLACGERFSQDVMVETSPSAV